MKRLWRDMSKESRIEHVKRYVDQGKSASEIAALVEGATRNSIIGFAHRNKLALGKPSAATPSTRKRKPKPRQPPKERSIKAAPVAKPKPISESSPAKPKVADKVATEVIPREVVKLVRKEPNILQLASDMCRWPIVEIYRGQEPEDILFCGKRTEDLQSFCTHHRKIAYTPR